MQAIETKYLSPTHTKPARIAAKCEAGQIVISWDDELTAPQMHRHAAEKLCEKLGWSVDGMHSGFLPNDHGAHVFEER